MIASEAKTGVDIPVIRIEPSESANTWIKRALGLPRTALLSRMARRQSPI